MHWTDKPFRQSLLQNEALGDQDLAPQRIQTRVFFTAYVNLGGNKKLKDEFGQGHELSRILETIEIQTREKIVPEKPLLILDEIQGCSQALTSLKYFSEQMPELAVAAARSLLGLAIHKGTGFPVGKVNILGFIQ